MSLAVSATNLHEHYIAVDTATSIKFEETSYRVSEESTKDKLIVLDGEAYFFSGDKNLIINLKIRFQEQNDRSFDKITEIAKNLFQSHAEKGDELAIAKYGFDENGLAYAQFTNNWLHFKPTDRYYGDARNLFLTYGANMKQASGHLDLSCVEITADFFIPVYEAVANEGVGNSIFVYHLTSEKWGVTEEIMLNEPENIKKINLTRVKRHATFAGSGVDAFPVTALGEGDGQKKFDSDNPISPDLEGQAMSGRGFTIKPDGSYDMFYFSSNYGRERSLRLKDNEVLLKSENSKIHMQAKTYEIEAEDGAVKITLSNGSYFELTEAGDINAHAINNIKLTADALIQFESDKYEFL